MRRNCFGSATTSGPGSSRICRPMCAALSGLTIAGSSAGSFMSSRAVAAGKIARPNMVRRLRSITVSCAGRGAGYGTGRVRAISRDPNDRLHACQSAPLGCRRKRMARPRCKWFFCGADLISLRQRIRSQGPVLPWSSWRSARPGPHKGAGIECAIFRHRLTGQAVGRSPGGRNTKIHALADAKGRLIAILLTGGEAHDCPVAEHLFRRVKSPQRLLGYKAYDSTELREELSAHGTKPIIPNRSNRKQQFTFNKRLHKLRWRVENAFNRLKDCRRIATRYDKLARNLCGGFNESGPLAYLS